MGNLVRGVWGGPGRQKWLRLGGVEETGSHRETACDKHKENVREECQRLWQSEGTWPL